MFSSTPFELRLRPRLCVFLALFVGERSPASETFADWSRLRKGRRDVVVLELLLELLLLVSRPSDVDEALSRTALPLLRERPLFWRFSEPLRRPRSLSCSSAD
eukprot:scaffold129_cov254-Pinguiococcus_pyrenoidosus.AAC.16